MKKESFTNNLLKVSATELAWWFPSSACPRCAQLYMQQRSLPFRVGPAGVLSRLDKGQKIGTKGFISTYGRFPNWLGTHIEGEIVNSEELGIKFYYVHKANGVLLTGFPDIIIRQPDGSYAIVDFKTATFTEGQESVLQSYLIQLNAYALILESWQLHVSSLGLVFFEASTVECSNFFDLQIFEEPEPVGDDFFRVRFNPKYVPVEVNLTAVTELLPRVRELYTMPPLLRGRDDCKNCTLFNSLIKYAISTIN